MKQCCILLLWETTLSCITLPIIFNPCKADSWQILGILNGISLLLERVNFFPILIGYLLCKFSFLTCKILKYENARDEFFFLSFFFFFFKLGNPLSNKILEGNSVCNVDRVIATQAEADCRGRRTRVSEILLSKGGEICRKNGREKGRRARRLGGCCCLVTKFCPTLLWSHGL